MPSDRDAVDRVHLDLIDDWFQKMFEMAMYFHLSIPDAEDVGYRIGIGFWW